MRRREFIGMLGGAAAAWPLAAQAQSRDRLARIGYFVPPSRTADDEEFVRGLRDLNWVEGENIHIEYRSAEGDDARLPALASELVGLNVDVIVTTGTPGAFAAHRATSTIPIVVITASDLVDLGLVASLAHPGGNITGQTFFASQLAAKRLEFLKAIAPSSPRAGVLLLRGSPANARALAVMTIAAKALKMELRPIEVGSLGEFERALSDAGSDPIGGVVIADTTLFLANPVEVAAIVQKHGLPSVASPVIAARGGLLGYGVDFTAMFRHAGVFVDKILRGAEPGDIPIEQPTKFKTVVNLKAAKALGIEIPTTLLAGADEVIE